MEQGCHRSPHREWGRGKGIHLVWSLLSLEPFSSYKCFRCSILTLRPHPQKTQYQLELFACWTQQEEVRRVASNCDLFVQRNKNTLLHVKGEAQQEVVHFYKANQSLDLLSIP